MADQPTPRRRVTMAKPTITCPRAGEIGVPERKWYIVPSVLPVPPALEPERIPTPDELPVPEPERVPA
jgi:hypothetical protein